MAAELRRRIVSGELEVGGDPLPSEGKLMSQFGVSRPTLREAFRILESEQLIRVLRGARGGARVLKPDPASQHATQESYSSPTAHRWLMCIGQGQCWKNRPSRSPTGAVFLQTSNV